MKTNRMRVHGVDGMPRLRNDFAGHSEMRRGEQREQRKRREPKKSFAEVLAETEKGRNFDAKI